MERPVVAACALFLLLLVVGPSCRTTTDAFSIGVTVAGGRYTSAAGTSSRSSSLTRPDRRSCALRAVSDVGSEDAFDKVITDAGGRLVVVDYSTTWCGPCKVIAPKFDEFSEKYTSAVFIKVIGDASPEASKLMKREGVRSVPSFHYFVNGEKVEVVNGANAEAIEAAITKHLS